MEGKSKINLTVLAGSRTDLNNDVSWGIWGIQEMWGVLDEDLSNQTQANTMIGRSIFGTNKVLVSAVSVRRAKLIAESLDQMAYTHVACLFLERSIGI